MHCTYMPETYIIQYCNHTAMPTKKPYRFLTVSVAAITFQIDQPLSKPQLVNFKRSINIIKPMYLK